MNSLTELRELAEQATPGPWHRHTYGHRDIRQLVRVIGRQLRAGVWPSTDATWVHPDANGDMDPSVCLVGNGPKQTHNGDFIAACSPEVIKALVAVAEAAEGFWEDSGLLREHHEARVIGNIAQSLDALKEVLK